MYINVKISYSVGMSGATECAFLTAAGNPNIAGWGTIDWNHYSWLLISDRLTCIILKFRVFPLKFIAIGTFYNN